MNDNIVPFPNMPLVRIEEAPEIIIGRLTERKHQAVDECLDFFLPGILKQFQNLGFNIQHDNDLIMLLVMFRAILNRSLGLPHELHGWIDQWAPQFEEILAMLDESQYEDYEEND